MAARFLRLLWKLHLFLWLWWIFLRSPRPIVTALSPNDAFSLLHLRWKAQSWANQTYQPEEHTIPHQTLLVGCVDNHLARRALASTRNVVFLDNGNHHDAGQVLLTTGADRQTTLAALESAEKSGATAHLPALELTFPALLEPPAEEEPEDALTCEGRVEQGQHLLVNDLVATVCSGYIYRLLHRQPVTSFLAFCDLTTLAVRPIPLSRDNLLAYLVP